MSGWVDILRRFLLVAIKLVIIRWGSKMEDFDKIFKEWLGSMRNPTEEEWDAVNNYIHSISIDTGVNIFDIMDEYENKEELK